GIPVVVVVANIPPVEVVLGEPADLPGIADLSRPATPRGPGPVADLADDPGEQQPPQGRGGVHAVQLAPEGRVGEACGYFLDDLVGVDAADRVGLQAPGDQLAQWLVKPLADDPDGGQRVVGPEAGDGPLERLEVGRR